MKKIARVLCFFLALPALTALPRCFAQDVSGMTGVVTDPSGAAVPGATVTLTNTTRGLKFTQTTNAVGSYRFSEVPPGAGYEAVFSAGGFAPLNIKNIYLTVSTVRTQNASLKIGANAEAVEVTATNSEVTIDTTDATIGNTFDVEALNSLPVQQRNDPTALFKLQPGVTDNGSVTGARVDQNNITLDGLDVNDFATGGASQGNSGSGISSGFEGSIVGHAPIDSVEEFHGNVAGNEASSGPASGGQFSLVTKSGTNKFHGNINEYHRDPSLVANSWFNNNATPTVPRNHLIQNQFGGNIGGPIRKDKAYFFFDFNESRIIRSVDVQRTVPLDNLRAGNIGYINSAGGISYLSPAQVAALDPAGIGEDANWIAAFSSRFPRSNNMSTGDGVNSGGFLFNAPDNDYETNYVGRVDYNLTDKLKLFGRFTIARENAVENPNEFPGDPVTNPLVDRSYAAVVGLNWVINDHMTNQITYGETVQKLSFPNAFNPQGTTFFTFSDGTGPALTSSLYLNPNAQARRVPIPVLRDDFSLIKGNHTWQFGGSFKNILTHDSNAIDYNTTEVGPGGYVPNLTASMAPTDLNPSNEANYDYDQAFLYSLGFISEVSADFNYTAAGTPLKQLTGDQRLYRYYQTQLFAQDTWKVTPSLTATFGLNYQYYSVPYEVHGLESTEPFTFDQYFQARLAQSSLSQSGASTVPLIPYYLGGKPNNGPPLYQPEYRNLAPHVGLAWNPGFDKKMVINLGAAIVYDRTVVNAIQFVQDQDSYLFQQTLPLPQGVNGNIPAGVATGPRLDKNNDISNVTGIVAPATPKPPYEPFVSGGTPFGLLLGNAFNATIDPSLKTPYSIAYNGGVQRSLPGDMVLKASYAGRLGRRLLSQADANQLLEFVDPKSGQLFSQAFAALTKQLRANATTVVPQPWFENVIGASAIPSTATETNFSQYMVDNIPGYVYRGDFGDSTQWMSYNGLPLNVGSASQFSENTFYGNKGFSSYNSLLLTLQKNLSHGLQYDFNYTYSHSIDNISLFANGSGDTGIGGIGLICDVVRPRECRANSDFDVRQYITGDATYQLPFGRKRMFYSNPSFLVNELIGDWSVSGIYEWHTGMVWGTNSNAFVASYSNDAPGILVGPRSAVATHLRKVPGVGVNNFANQANARAAYEGPIGFQIGARNSLRGPGFFNADIGLAKTFPVYAEKVNLKFRADSFNTFNHPNFQIPAENGYNGLDQQDFTSSTFGQISYTVAPDGNLNNGARVLQVSLRLEF